MTLSPETIRDENYTHLRGGLNDRRRAVLIALAVHGPCTTRELAERSHTDILSVRPRITELFDVQLVMLVGRQHGEGVYRVSTEEEWCAWYARLRAERLSAQQQLI